MGMLRITLYQSRPDAEKSFVYIVEFQLDLMYKIVSDIVYTKRFRFMVFCSGCKFIIQKFEFYSIIFDSIYNFGNAEWWYFYVD